MCVCCVYSLNTVNSRLQSFLGARERKRTSDYKNEREIKMMKKVQIYAGCSIFVFFFFSRFSFDHDSRREDEREIQSIQRNPTCRVLKAAKRGGRGTTTGQERDWTQHIPTSSLFLSLSLVAPTIQFPCSIIAHTQWVVQFLDWCRPMRRECFWLGHQIQCHHSKPLCLFFLSFFF